MSIKINLLYLIYYLFVINILSAIVFYLDKRKAMRKGYRTPEAKLHLFELLGGVFVILPMLYIIRHKNRKSEYFILTYLIFSGWVTLLFFILND